MGLKMWVIKEEPHRFLRKYKCAGVCFSLSDLLTLEGPSLPAQWLNWSGPFTSLGSTQQLCEVGVFPSWSLVTKDRG